MQQEATATISAEMETGKAVSQTTTLSPYIGFDGKCKEAMTFYQQCLGGELTIDDFNAEQMGSECFEQMKGKVVHSMLKSKNVILFGTDMTSPSGHHKGNNIAMCLNCGSEEEIKTLFQQFAEGGKVLDPLGIKFWGGMFGALTDKFGINWLFHFDKNPQG